MAIIGISGKVGSGKDLVGKIIQYLTAEDVSRSCYANLMTNKSIDGYNNSNWKIVKFADKLKDIICILIGCTREQLEDREFKEKELGEEWWFYKGEVGIYPYNTPYEANKKLPLIKYTPRKLLQDIGTDLFRNQLHPNIWVNSLMSDYKPSLDSTTEENKRLLSIWKNMNTRCTNPNYEKYHKYGGRGINIHKEWKDFEVFKVWALTNGYTNNLTLDRKDTDGSYEPSNCRFATSSLQAFNKNSYDGGTSNIKGVNLYSSTGKWQAQIQSKGIKQNLGYYDTEELAKQAYLKEYNKILFELEQETKLLQRKNYPMWIITDCRFKNELQAIKDRDGIVIRVNRNNSLFKSVIHESETALDNAKFDYIIDNNGTIEELIEKVKEILIKEKIL